ncbi:TPA: hypothetical protein SK266_000626 [Yersinia enterocolitica]|nr:hypothetical protein [Yersinia enterocolitica]HEI6862108.1 hypothetical protein [Yersinia enterocolitica]
MEYSDIISTIALIISIIAVPATYYLGYKAAVKNDKRKEWNQLAEPIIIKLEEHCELLERKALPHMHDPYFPNDKMAAIRRRLKTKERIVLDEIFNRYLALFDEIKKSPTPIMLSKVDEPEWIDRYPEALEITKELMIILKLK